MAEFSKSFRFSINYELQISDKLAGWLREIWAENEGRPERVSAIMEELQSRLSDREHVNIVDADSDEFEFDEVCEAAGIDLGLEPSNG